MLRRGVLLADTVGLVWLVWSAASVVLVFVATALMTVGEQQSLKGRNDELRAAEEAERQRQRAEGQRVKANEKRALMAGIDGMTEDIEMQTNQQADRRISRVDA